MLKEVRASHVLVKTEDEAKKILMQVKFLLKMLQDKFLFVHQVMKVEI